MRYEPGPAPFSSHGPAPSPGSRSRVQPPGTHHGSAGASCPPSAVPRVLVGREDDIAHLVALARLPTTRVIVITGPAGVGKTALALHVAQRLREHFPDGDAFIDLQASCGAPPMPPTQHLNPAASSTHSRPPRPAHRRLLIADDVGGIDQISSLMPAGDHSLLIATSRNPLPALGESVKQHNIAPLSSQDATALVAGITRTIRTLDSSEQLQHLAALCAGLPLALWIAAERATARPLMPLAAVLEDLRTESSPWLDLAASTERPQETLRTVLTCCYNALPASLSHGMRLLAGHPGPDFSASAARVVLHRPIEQTQALLDALAAMHWVENPSRGRYRLPTAVRSFAADRAHIEEKPDDHRRLVERIGLWYLHTAHAAAVEIQAPTFTAQTTCSPSAGVSDGRTCARCWFADERANIHAAAHAAQAHHLGELSSDLSHALGKLTELVELR